MDDGEMTEGAASGAAPAAELSRLSKLWTLFFVFAKIATFVIGGGYAILPVAEREFAEKRGWIKDEELLDMLAIVQTVPGIIAGNTAIYIGYRVAGFWGALCSLIGIALPSVVIITLIAAFFSRTPMDNVWLQGAFIGVRAAICGLMLATAWKMWGKVMDGVVPYLLGLGGAAGIVMFSWNPALVIVAAALVGAAYYPACWYWTARRRAAGNGDE